MIEAQAQANAQTTEAAAMAEVQKQQALAETQIQVEQAKSEFETQRMQAELQIKQQLAQQKFEFDMKLAQADIQVNQAKEKDIEDRKDQRTRIQASQQSKMISQRQNDSLPTDFEQPQDVNIGGLDLSGV